MMYGHTKGITILELDINPRADLDRQRGRRVSFIDNACLDDHRLKILVHVFSNTGISKT